MNSPLGRTQSIQNFLFFLFLQNGPLLIAFLAISDQYATLFLFRNFYFCEYFYKMPAGGHFRCPKITFGRISGHFRSIRNFFKICFCKMAAVCHFGCPKFTLDHIPGHFRSIQIFLKFVFYLDVQKSLSISFLSISHRYTTFFLNF